MKYLKNTLFIFLIILPAFSYASESLQGNYRGVGFTLGSGSTKITESDMLKWASSLVITEAAEHEMEFAFKGEMQQNSSSEMKNFNSSALYYIKWEDGTSGIITKKEPGDGTNHANFLIKDKKLIIKSWSSKKQFQTTQVFIKK